MCPAAPVTNALRPALAADVAGCVTLLRDWIDETPWMPPLWERAAMEAFWSEVFADDTAWVAERGGQLVGFCFRDEDNLGALYVAAAMRGGGVGKRLLDQAKAGCEELTVWAFEANVQARRFYRREGLVEVSRELDEELGLVDVEHRWRRPVQP